MITFQFNSNNKEKYEDKRNPKVSKVFRKGNKVSDIFKRKKYN